MLKKSVTITTPRGLELRPIAELVQVASRYESRVYLETATKHVNAKSIMGMMALQLGEGENVIVMTEGEDEAAAMSAIEGHLTGVAI